MSPKRKRIALIVPAALVVLALITSCAFSTMRSTTGMHGETVTSTGAPVQSQSLTADLGSSPVERKRTPSTAEVCEKLAPAATRSYVGSSQDRARRLEEYFTADASGLDIPVERIMKQSADSFSGSFVVSADSSTVTCSVWTGLESPWYLTFKQTHGDWKASRIEGPAQGAYRSPEGFSR